MTSSDSSNLAKFLDRQHPAVLNAFKLGLFAVVAAIILGGTYSGTEERIAISQAIVEERALLAVVDTIPVKNVDINDRILVPESQLARLEVDSGESIQVVRDDSAVPVAFIVPSVAPEGYSGDIRLLVGLDLQGTVTGVRATEHRETPGLGDKVDTKKSNWILGFNGKSLNDPLNGWAVKKDGGDFDAFTGATITPRAVVTQVEAVLLFYQENRAELIALAATSVAENLADETESLVTNLEESP
jgi:electron transport complex protein RnfG